MFYKMYHKINPNFRGVKFTLIAVFDCHQGCVYFHFRPIAGTSTDSYVEFLDQLMTYLPGMGDPNFEVRTIMHDNLSSHLNVRVAATINQAGHRVIARYLIVPRSGKYILILNLS